jgi:pyruvate,water dikinase
MKCDAAYVQNLSDCRENSLVGGKAVNLGKLIRAGFPVPTGFVITTLGYELAKQTGQKSIPDTIPPELIDRIREAYREMGGGAVAVRSSATAEDMGAASMAGQYETFLDIEGEDDLLDAVRRCWASLDAPRTRAYLQEHGIDLNAVAMAVVVQRLVAADVAGVLFTSNPHPGAHREMLLEASWGLGEMVVSGRVQPDVLRLDKETGRVVAATIAEKRIYLPPGVHQETQVEQARRNTPSLKGREVHELWQLGRRTAEYFGSPQDIEWAIQNGELYLIQSRPITTGGEAESAEPLLDQVKHHLRDECAKRRGPWALHNLAETLPHPTPLTWSVMKRFMSGAGGFGAMYRQAGLAPSPLVDREGFLDCIAGRIYMDASRAPEMFFENFPFAYDLEALKHSPDASQLPPTLSRGSFTSRMQVARKLKAVNQKLGELSRTLDRDLRENLFPEIQAYVASAKTIDLTTVSTDWMIELWQEHERFVLDTFAPRLLMPSLISGMAMEQLRAFLQEHFWNIDPDATAQELSAGGAANRTVLADAELHQVAAGTRALESWLSDHGHRAAGEFDLAAPRWREQPQAVREMASRLGSGDGPLQRHERTVAEVMQRAESLRQRLDPLDQIEFDERLNLLRRYIAFREDGKDLLMLGYDLLRDVALEAGRRLEVGQDIFYLTRDELFDALRVGFAPQHLIQQRKIAFAAEEKLSLPRVIDAEAIETLGEAPAAPQMGGYLAFAVSAGEAVGPARVMHSPTQAGDLGKGYILVCPSTDPSWTPLFVNAAGLVLECGGTLSHGAVVAREMGLPAVVLPGATRIFCDNEHLRVDGRRGWVGRTAEESVAQSHTPAAEESLANNMHIAPELIPPPPGRKDRRAAKVRNVCAALWTLYLLGFFLLPQKWVHQPTLAALDWLMWPIVRVLGRPGTVALVAVLIALVTLSIQKLLTDNRRLLEAKRRAAALKSEAELLPKGSPRRELLTRLASPVHLRSLMAAMAPIGVLLGPMVMPFVWFQQRMDPATWNAPAGSAVQVIAMVDGEWTQPVSIEVPDDVTLDPATPAERTLPPLRQTLQRLLALYTAPRVASTGPWELAIAPDVGRQPMAEELKAYLDAGIPPQGITWQLRPRENMNGRFDVKVAAAGSPAATIGVVIGDRFPPAPTSVAGRVGSPVKLLRVSYSKSKQEEHFLTPFALLGHPSIAPRLAAMDIGWLWLYILVYLPALFAVRSMLKVA